jgi:hypothetical protein
MAGGGDLGSLGSAYVDVTTRLDLAGSRAQAGAAVSAMSATVAGRARATFAPLTTAFNSVTATLAGLARRAATTALSPLAGAITAIGRTWRNAILSTTGFGALSGGLNAGVLTEGFKAAIDQASGLQESMSKVGFTFHAAAGTIISGSDEMARKFGVNKRLFIDSATNIGLIAKGAGLSETAAAGMGNQFARLALDVASFDNVPIEEAMVAIRAGLVGESEPLRRFGVMMTEDAVKAEALRMGLAATAGELSNQDKILARASLIRQGLADRTGDLERTQDSWANRSRMLTGQLENLAGRIGELLLPALSRLSGVFSEVIADIDTYMAGNREEFNAWAETLAGSFDYLKAAFADWPTALAAVREQVQEWATNVQDILNWLVANAQPAFERIGAALQRSLAGAFDQALTMARDFAGRLLKFANPSTAAVALATNAATFLAGVEREQAANAPTPFFHPEGPVLTRGPREARDRLDAQVGAIREERKATAERGAVAVKEAEGRKQLDRLKGQAAGFLKNMVEDPIRAGAVAFMASNDRAAERVRKFGLTDAQRDAARRAGYDPATIGRPAGREGGGMGAAAERSQVFGSASEVAQHALTTGFAKAQEDRERERAAREKNMEAHLEEIKESSKKMEKTLAKPGGLRAILS